MAIEVIKAEMENLEKRFQEIQKSRVEHLEAIKKIDEESLQLKGSFTAYQKMLITMENKPKENDEEI